MKINKIVAAGAAATLAVTSLASVASAKNPRSWSLVYNYGILTATPVVTDKGYNALTSVDTDARIFGTGPTQKNIVNTKGGITEAYDLKAEFDPLSDGTPFSRANDDANSDGNGGTIDRADTNGDGRITDADFDAVIPVYLTASTDAMIKNSSGVNKLLTAYAGNLTVVVRGRKRDNTNFVAIEKKTVLKQDIDKIVSNGKDINIKADGTVVDADQNLFTDEVAIDVAMGNNSALCYLPLFVTAAPEGFIMPTDFDAVDNIKIDVSGMSSFTWITDDKDLFFLEQDFIATGWNFDWLNYVTVAANVTSYGEAGEDDLVPFDYATAWYYADGRKGTDWTGNANPADGIPQGATGRAMVTFDVPVLYDVDGPNGNDPYMSAIQLTGDSVKAGGLLTMYGEYVRSGLAADETRGGTAVAADGYDLNDNIQSLLPATVETVGNLLIEKICDVIDEIHVEWRITSAELAESNAWLPMTDVLPTDGTLYRNEIWLLSDTDDYNSLSHDISSNGNVANWDTNQTYTVEDYRRGTRPYGFGGLASQVADYFNKELNGTITFTFADVSNLNGRTWLNGGVPSTEVGLRNVLSGANPDDFALYFNYNATTGSLETVVDIDVDAGEVTFDISNILDQLGGYTIGTIHDIYYGMTKYTSLRNNVPGMWVSQVTLRAEDGADVSPAVEDDDVTTVEDDDDVAVEDDDDDVAIEDDDDVAIEDDDDIAIEDDDDVAIEDDDDTAGEVEVVSGDDDDANPHTGVALAVVPALVAAAAIVVSKKRK